MEAVETAAEVIDAAVEERGEERKVAGGEEEKRVEQEDGFDLGGTVLPEAIQTLKTSPLYDIHGRRVTRRSQRTSKEESLDDFFELAMADAYHLEVKPQTKPDRSQKKKRTPTKRTNVPTSKRSVPAVKVYGAPVVRSPVAKRPKHSKSKSQPLAKTLPAVKSPKFSPSPSASSISPATPKSVYGSLPHSRV